MTREHHTLVEMDLGDIRRALRNSTEFFLEFALADEIAEDKTIPDFHILVFRRFIDFVTQLEYRLLVRHGNIEACIAIVDQALYAVF